MDQLVDRLLSFVTAQDNPLGLLVLGLSAIVEYVFPPFPGDTVTLFGAFLITAHGWSFPLVFGVVILGSAAGAMADFWFGTWLKSRPVKRPAMRKKIDSVVEKFQRHGEVYIVLNRFLPGVRALFFVAAGMAGMRARWVLLWATVSAILWNLLLVAVGSTVGANFEDLKAFFATYSRFVWIALGILAIAWILRYVVKRLSDRT